MKPFRFRLDRLRRLKEAEKTQRVLELAEARRHLEHLESDLNAAVARMSGAADRYAALSERPSRPGDWAGSQEALLREKHRAHKAAESAHKAAQVVEEVRERLIEQTREVQILSRLRRRKREQYDLDMRRAEQKQNDARALERYNLRENAE